MPRSTSLFFALFATIFFIIFSFTLTNIASPYVVGDLGGSTDIGTYTISFFGLGNALSIPLGKHLLSRFSVRNLVLAHLGLFAFFSLMCGIAPNYPVFIGFRLCQGLVSGPLYPYVTALITVLAPKEKKAHFTAILVTIFAVVPVLGACWGGWIAYDYIWRLSFFINAPLLLLLGVFLWRKLRGFSLHIPKTSFDGIGYLFFSLAVFSLSFSVITGQELDWFRSELITALISIGSISLAFFILWELNHPFPVLELKLFKKPAFAYGIFNLAFLFSAYFGMVILLGLWLELDVQYTPIWIGLIIGTMAVAGLFPPFLMLAGVKRFDPRIPLAIAIAFFAISCFHTMNFNVEIDFARIAFSRVIAGFGLALFLPPIFRLCFQSYPEEKTLDVLSVFQVVRSLASALGCSIYTTVWQRREVFFHDRLGSRITELSFETQQYFEHAEEINLTGVAAAEQLNILLDRQATSLALNDTFWLMAWIMVALLGVLFLTTLPKKQLVDSNE